MAVRLAGRRPDGPVFRLGRGPDPWGWPDWSLAGPGGTIGNRRGDPFGRYRVLYACSERLGAFLETPPLSRSGGPSCSLFISQLSALRLLLVATSAYFDLATDSACPSTPPEQHQAEQDDRRADGKHDRGVGACPRP